MPEGNPKPSSGLDISFDEFIELKQKLIESQLQAQNYKETVVAFQEQNELLKDKCQQIGDLVQKIYFDKEQQELANKYAHAREADFYYNIDIVGACSVKCPSCPVGNAASHPTKGMMDVGIFTKILEKIASESKGKRVSIELYNWGESILHPKLPEIIRITKGFGFICGMSNNLNTAVDLRRVVQAEPDYMRISISGSTNSSYQQTHVGGDVNAVKSNLYLLRHYLDKYKNTHTQVELGYLVYRHNFEDDLQQIRRLCKDLSFSLNWSFAILMPVEKAIEAAQGHIDPAIQETVDKLVVSPAKWRELSEPYRSQHPDCAMHDTRTVINYDGSVPLCCGTYQPEMTIADNFLEVPHDELQSRKHSHSLCEKCMENMVYFMFTCVTPPEVEDYARSELDKLGNFIGKYGR